jgi:ribosomal protein L5
VPASTIAGEISTNLTSNDSFEGLANLVADEISNASWGLEDSPILKTIGIDPYTLVY